MQYFYSKNILSNFNDSEIKVRESLMDIGFGVLTEINMKDAFKTKLDLEYRNYKILGACNPTLAYDALNDEEMIGILMPCNILIIDNDDKTTKIVFPVAKSLLDITQNQDVLNLADKVDKLLKAAFDNID
tara:strand:- start:356 stop:745 length:390 start_codon:yes stop_codon:yes gene_type:complete